MRASLKTLLGLVRGLSKLLGLVALWLVGILVGVFVALQTDWARDGIRETVVGHVNAGIAGRVEIDRLGGSLFFSLRLEGVRIFDPDGLKVLDVQALSADFFPFLLLDKRIELSELAIDGPDATIFDGQGRIAIARAFEPRVPSEVEVPRPEASPGPFPWTIRVRSVALKRARIEGLLPDTPLDLEGLRLAVEVVFAEGTIRWRELALDASVVSANGLGWVLGAGGLSLRTSGRLSPIGAIVEAFSLQLGPHALELTAGVDLLSLSEGRLDVSALQVDTRGWPFVPAPVQGVVNLQGRVALSRGNADAHFVAYTPLGDIWIQGGSTMTVGPAGVMGSGIPEIGDWSLTVDAAHLRLPAGLAPDVDAAEALLGRGQAEVMVHVSGRGLPGSPEHQMRGDVDLVAVAGDGTVGHGLARLRYLPPVGPRPPGISFRFELDRMGFQPWLTVAGLPRLDGELEQVTARGILSFDLDGGTDDVDLIMVGGLRLSADGLLAEDAEPIRVRRVDSRFQLQWGGRQLPVLSLFLQSGAVRAFGAELGGLRFSLFSGVIGDDGTRIDGELELDGASFDTMRVARVRMPIAATLSDGFELEGARLRPTLEGVRLGPGMGMARVETSLTVAREGSRHRVRGTVGASGVRAAGIEVGGLATDLNLRMPRLGGPVSPVDGAVAGTFKGTVQGLRMRGAELGVEKSRVDVELSWPGGLGGALELTGAAWFDRLRLGGVRVQQVSSTFGGRVNPRGRELEDLLPSALATVQARDVRFDSPDFMTARTIRGVRFVATRTAEGGLPLELNVDLDDRYSFETQASVRLPRRRRPLSARVDAFRLVDGQGDVEIVRMQQASLSEEGVLGFSGLDIRAPDVDGSWITLGGYFDLASRELDFNLDLVEVDLDRYLALAEAVLQQPFGGERRPVGVLNLDLDVFGTLAEPDISLELGLDGAGLGASRLALSGKSRDGAVTGELSVDWRGEGARLASSFSLPARVGLEPPGLSWEEGRPLQASLSLDEPAIPETLAFLEALLGVKSPIPVTGGLRLTVEADGRPQDPELRMSLHTQDIVIDGFDDGDLHLELSSRAPTTNAMLWWERDNGDLLARIRSELPFTIARALSSADPIASVRRSLETSDGFISVLVPRTRLAASPLRPFLPSSLASLELATDLTLDGRLASPALAGRVEVVGLEGLPENSETRLRIDTALDVLSVSLHTVGAGGKLWLDGSLKLPVFSRLFSAPEELLLALEDPGMGLDLFSADIPSGDLWRLHPAAGDFASTFMPDAWTMLHVNVRGSRAGPTAHVLARVRTSGEASRASARLNPRQRVALRNIANDILITAEMTPVRSTARVLMLQEPSYTIASRRDPSRTGHEHFATEFLANIGTEALLKGSVSDLSNVEILGNVDAHHFGLNGVASALRSVLGSTDGFINGRIEVDGTFGDPHLSGGLAFNFKDLAIAPLGLRREDVRAELTFSEGKSVRLTGLRFTDPPVAPETEPSEMKVRFNATVGALEPSAIEVDAGVDWTRFQIVTRSDAEVQLTGGVNLRGNLGAPRITGRINVDRASLSPELSSRSVRAIGLPAGVTMVRGEARPPPFVEAESPYRTDAHIDIRVDIPARSTRLEPALFLAIGEVRAVLEPNTGPEGLRIRTSRGRIGIVGTIFVPSDNIQVYGKTFVIDPDSRIIFTGDMDNDPQLRLTARYNIEHVDLSPLGLEATRESYVGVRVGGNPVNPELGFISDPRMDEGNMLSIIALGSPAGGGDELGTQARGQLLTAFLNMATLELGRGLTDSLPIEILKLDTLTGDLGDVRLTLGKRITDDLYIYYRSDWGGSRQTNTFWAEYRLGRILYVAAEYGDNPNPERPAESSVRASFRFSP